MDDKEVMLLIGGAVLLYFLYTQSQTATNPAVIAAQTAALQAQANSANMSTIGNAISNIAGDF
jgi:hypothetical protein